MSIIQILQEAACSRPTTETVRQCMEALAPYREKIQAAFGLRFVDEMFNADQTLRAAELDEAYQRGFGDAFQLWLEVFSRYSSYPQR